MSAWTNMTRWITHQPIPRHAPASHLPSPHVIPRKHRIPLPHQVNLATIGGTGPAGRITASDVERAAGKAPSEAATPAAPAPAAPAPTATRPPAAGAKAAPPTTVSELRGTTVPFSSMQKAVVNNMTASLSVRAWLT